MHFYYSTIDLNRSCEKTIKFEFIAQFFDFFDIYAVIVYDEIISVDKIFKLLGLAKI